MPIFVPNRDNLVRMRALLDADIGVEEVSFQLNCSIRTVERWRDRFAAGDENPQFMYDNRAHNHGPEKLNNQQVIEIQNAMEQDPFQAASKLADRLNLEVSEQTIRRALKTRCALQYYKAAKKTALSYNDRRTAKLC